jgi:drug/metabolite transporter (DMT)-like permease
VGLILGLTAALCWGVADFLARFAARRVGAYRTSFFMQLVGFTVLSIFLFSIGARGSLGADAAAGWQPWAWAALAGLLNTGCSLAFYRSFEIGVLTVVAPIASSYPVLTLLLSVVSGERLTQRGCAGIAAVLVGVVLASTSFQPSGDATADALPGAPRRLSSGVGWAVAASAGFGVLFWLLGFHVMPVLGGYASVWVIRLVTFSTLGLVAAPARQRLRPPRGDVWWLLVGIGILDTSAFVASNLGLKTGHVAVVTVIASLFSAVTVFLAWVFLRERLQRSQWLGIFLIFVGIILASL